MVSFGDKLVIFYQNPEKKINKNIKRTNNQTNKTKTKTKKDIGLLRDMMSILLWGLWVRSELKKAGALQSVCPTFEVRILL